MEFCRVIEADDGKMHICLRDKVTHQRLCVYLSPYWFHIGHYYQ